MNQEVLKAIKGLERAQARLNKLQNECSHTNYEVISNNNDHNGWDVCVTITWTQTRHCNDCDKVFSVETGKEFR